MAVFPHSSGRVSDSNSADAKTSTLSCAAAKVIAEVGTGVGNFLRVPSALSAATRGRGEEDIAHQRGVDLCVNATRRACNNCVRATKSIGETKRVCLAGRAELMRMELSGHGQGDTLSISIYVHVFMGSRTRYEYK
eukprot:m.76313 g.76313  ORF g.76313 m.76313 type:complete len:136 (+) comp24883_c0_seq2:754-1161(+)